MTSSGRTVVIWDVWPPGRVLTSVKVWDAVVSESEMDGDEEEEEEEEEEDWATTARKRKERARREENMGEEGPRRREKNAREESAALWKWDVPKIVNRNAGNVLGTFRSRPARPASFCSPLA